MKISDDLKLEILCGLTATTYYDFTHYKAKKYSLDLSKNNELLNECKSWLKTITSPCVNFFKIKFDIGNFIGVYPISISKGIVEFSVDFVRPENWKDWF